MGEKYFKETENYFIKAYYNNEREWPSVAYVINMGTMHSPTLPAITQCNYHYTQFSEYIIRTSPPTPASCNGNKPPNMISPGTTIALLAPADDTLFELNGADAWCQLAATMHMKYASKGVLERNLSISMIIIIIIITRY